MSIDNYKKYGKFNNLYNSNKAGFDSKSKKWYVSDYIKIPNSVFGIIFHKSKKIKVYDIIHELVPNYSIVNHNIDYN
jgi:hypothetical protein